MKIKKPSVLTKTSVEVRLYAQGGAFNHTAIVEKSKIARSHVIWAGGRFYLRIGRSFTYEEIPTVYVDGDHLQLAA